MLTITATPRTKEAAEALRAAGTMPAVMYGPKEAPVSVTISTAAFTKVWKQAGESTIITVEGIGGSKDVLIHDVQVHPLTDTPLHADLYVFDKTKKLTATIPLHFIGVSGAEKSGGVVIKVMHELEIEVLPAELPSHIDVDLAQLSEIGKHITVADLPLPPSAEVSNKDEIVALAEEAKEVVIDSAAPEIAPAVAEAQAAAAQAAAGKAADPEKKKSE